jgi:hypothetical protein
MMQKKDIRNKLSIKDIYDYRCPNDEKNEER